MMILWPKEAFELDEEPPEWKRAGPWLDWLLKTIGLVLLVAVSYDAGAASEAELAVDAFEREEHWRGLLVRSVDAGEGALTICLEVDADFHAEPFTPPTHHRADDRP